MENKNLWRYWIDAVIFRRRKEPLDPPVDLRVERQDVEKWRQGCGQQPESQHSNLDLTWIGLEFCKCMFNCLSFLFMQIIWRWTLVISPIQHQTSKSIPDRTKMKVARTCQRTINSDGKHCTPQETGFYGNSSQKGGRGGTPIPTIPILSRPW